jgi:TPP-dependent indolepyruvate ferredoxin oxidoreductase alpha subunit
MSSDLKRKKKQKKSNKPVYDHRKFVVHPTNYLYQRKTLLKKNDRIQKYINGLYKNVFVETKDNLFVFGCCVNEQKKYLKDNYGRVQFFTYPLPQKTTNLIKKSKNLIVLEQGDDFACREVGNLTKNLLLGNNTGSMPDMSKNYIVSKNYEKLFSAVKAIRPTFVIGDLGEYTKDTYGTIDACLCLGSSIGVATGCALAGYQKSLVITGDGAYLHSGKNALMESIERKITLKIVVLCNGGCRVTGGQKIPGDLFDQPKEVRVFKLNYDKTTTAVFKETLKKMIDSKFTTILYVLM